MSGVDSEPKLLKFFKVYSLGSGFYFIFYIKLFLKISPVCKPVLFLVHLFSIT